jgi:hypothetical protein
MGESKGMDSDMRRDNNSFLPYADAGDVLRSSISAQRGWYFFQIGPPLTAAEAR